MVAVGGHPIMLDLKKEELENQAQEELKRTGVQATTFIVDISFFEEVSSDREAIQKQHGLVNGLVNNSAVNSKIEDRTVGLFLLENMFDNQ